MPNPAKRAAQVKARIRIPKGWRRLRVAERIERGDKGDNGHAWVETGASGMFVMNRNYRYIRRVGLTGGRKG